MICTEKLKYEEEEWKSFVECINDMMKELQKDYPSVLVGMNVQNSGKRIKVSKHDQINERSWKNWNDKDVALDANDVFVDDFIAVKNKH